MSHVSLQEFLKTEPDGTLEAIAEQYNTTLLEVVKNLPSPTVVSGDKFDTVWDTVCEWGNVTTLVHTTDVILEFSGELPSGFHRHGYFNLRGKHGMSGHIKAENCTHIALIERKFMGMDTASILFFNKEGSAMLKIFLGRDDHRQLLSEQVSAFHALAVSFLMTPWLLFGAGGKGVGARTLELALAEQRPVVAVIRHADAATKLAQQGVQVFTGDACDASVVAAACRAAGPDALIISTMGGAQDYLAHRTVIDEAEKAGISRMILVTSLGCGDSWPFLSERAKAAFGQAVREKTLAESWLQTSQLDYAILRPGGLLDGAATGKAQRIQNQECHGFVNRADVAAHIHELANAPALNQQVYSLIEPDLKPA